MLYRLLGIVVWKAGRWFLRRKYGAMLGQRGLLVGGAAALVAALVAGGIKARSGGGSSQLTP